MTPQTTYSGWFAASMTIAPLKSDPNPARPALRNLASLSSTLDIELARLAIALLAGQTPYNYSIVVSSRFGQPPRNIRRALVKPLQRLRARKTSRNPQQTA